MRNPRLMMDVRRRSSIIANTMPRELLRVRLRQQRRYYLLSIGNDPSKASSNSWEYMFAASLAGVKGLSGCAGRQNSKSDPVQKPIVLELEERPMLH
jgi:hypothetical protein